MDPLEVRPGLTIPAEEIQFNYTRSGGPGGQNVNKVNTRVELLFDVGGSASLTEAQKAQLRRRLSRRINRFGVLRVVSQRQRSQAQNRRDAVERFVEMVAKALTIRKKRVATRPSRASKERRLQEKKRRAQIKRSRSRDQFPN